MKIKRVICGVSRGPESLEAVRQAVRIVPEDAEMLLVSVVEPPVTMPAAGMTGTEWSVPQYDPDMFAVIEQAAEKSLARARAEIPEGRPVKTLVVTGSPAPTLLQEIEDEHADVIVLGVREESRTLGILGGSVATWLVHEAHCPVYLAREAPDLGHFPRLITVGADGSPASVHALEIARAIAEQTGAQLRVVIAAHRGVDPAEVRQTLAAGPDLDVIELCRDPVDALIDMAGDITAIGSKGKHGLRRFGSVSERVAHRSPSSVLVVRPRTD